MSSSINHISNSFNIQATCDYLIRIKTNNDLRNLPIGKKLCIGRCSNILFIDHYPGPIIKNEILGIEIIEETESHVYVEVGGGEVWHDLVMWSVDNNYGGLENLSLIPGSVGASPIQNIGAYGVELADVFVRLRGYDMLNQVFKEYNHQSCQFGYRSSIFKYDLKNSFFISHVIFKLSKNDHSFNMSYGAIQEVVMNDDSELPLLKKISNAVIDIRRSKLPDPEKLGNCGSFFKNPIVGRNVADLIADDYDDLKTYPIDDRSVKIPAAWLIEKSGYKGKRIGDVGTFQKHALVIVNHGESTGQEIWEYAQEIIVAVKKKFRIELVPEVNVV